MDLLKWGKNKIEEKQKENRVYNESFKAAKLKALSAQAKIDAKKSVKTQGKGGLFSGFNPQGIVDAASKPSGRKFGTKQDKPFWEI